MSDDMRDRLQGGALARAGLLSDDGMAASVALFNRVAAEGFETIRVVFTDQHGILRGKTVTVRALGAVLADGIKVPSTLLLKDTSHRTVFPIWAEDSDSPMAGASDIWLVPDATRFWPVPWSPHSAWLMCDCHDAAGAPVPFAARHVLRRAMDRLATHDLAMVVGLEVEFHVLRVTDPALAHGDTTMPPAPPLTEALAPGYQFLTDTLYDALEPVMDRLRRASEALGLDVRSTEVEMGPGQFEFTFGAGDPMEQADALVLFRTMVKELCAREGLHATFMCRPRLDNTVASGWHIHQSLVDRQGANVFTPGADGALTATAAGWIAGLLAHARESCLLTTPTINGYRRYTPFQLAPDRIQWGRDNRGAMLRVLTVPGDAASRVENRVADPAANPYYALAAQILSGVAGIEAGLTPPPAVETPYASGAEALPMALDVAIAAFDGSQLYRSTLGDDFVDYLTHMKRAEWARYIGAVSEWEQAEYFRLF